MKPWNRLLPAILTISLFAGAASGQSLQLIPMPNQVQSAGGSFSLNNRTSIMIKGDEGRRIAEFLQKDLLKYTGITVKISEGNSERGIILRKLNPQKVKTGTYDLEIKPREVVISSSTDEGLFYGINSLLQLARKTPAINGSIILNGVTIHDEPRYEWRGFMLDESRHFFGKAKVKQLLDWMAFYKLNRFHWHLTDQPGWRIEIKKYPRLTTVGGIGTHTDPTASATYYSQEDIREIVAYATERFITVIPEIDMPGHATAANYAYPEFSGGGSKNYPEFTFNPGKEQTYSYLTDILREVDALFPSQMIHLGGDEVSFGNETWKTLPEIKELMQQKNLADLKAVEDYFVKRMADSIRSLNNKVLGWDEIVDSDLPVNETILFWWRHDKPQQLVRAFQKKLPVVLCPRLPLYFDFVQDNNHQSGRRWQSAFNTLDKVYAFSHEQVAEAKGKENLILGIQANLWTETIGSEKRLDYLLFPRISALAEAAWTQSSKKNFSDFEARIRADIELYKKSDIYYFDPQTPNLNSEPPAPVQKDR